MRTVTYQSVLWGAARLLGLDPVRDLNLQMAARLTEYITRAVAKGWRFEQWPDSTLTQQRYFRPVYDPAATYAASAVGAPVEVYFIAADRYYQALQPSTGQLPATWDPVGCTWTENSAYWAESHPRYCGPLWMPNTNYGVGYASGLPFQVKNPTDGNYYQCTTAHTSGSTFDATKWGLLTPFSRYISYNQPGQTVIWEAPSVCAFRRDPRVFTSNPWAIRTWRNDAGITFPGETVNSVWLQFWTAPPQFVSALFSATTAYAKGVTIYDPATGDCWTSVTTTTAGQNPSSTPASWSRILFPFVLAAYVKRMAMADLLRDQKQTDRAQAEQAAAEDELQDEADKALTGQGQTETATVETAQSPGIW